MSTTLIIVIAVVVVLDVLFIGGYLAVRRRSTDWSKHVAEADHALEAARAADRGWDRDLLDREARNALASRKPGWEFRDLHLVLVDDRPGVEEDRAHFVATGGDGEARVILARDERGNWHLESVA